MHIVGHVHRPQLGRAIFHRRGQRREVVAIGAVGIFGIIVELRLACLRLVLGHAVQVHDAVFQMNAVAWNADRALDQKHVRDLGVGLQKHDDVAALHLAIVDKGSPTGLRRQCDPVHHYVVADQQCTLHRARRNLKVLEDEGHHKQPDRQHGADRRDRFEEGFSLLGLASSVAFSVRCIRAILRLRNLGRFALTHPLRLPVRPSSVSRLANARCAGFDPSGRS